MPYLPLSDIDLYIGTPLELFHRLGRLTNVQAGFGDVIYAIKNSVLIQNAVLSTLLGGENADVNKRMLESCGNVCEVSILILF